MDVPQPGAITLTIRPVAHSLGIFLSQSLLEEQGLAVGDKVIVTTTLAIENGIERPLHASIHGRISTSAKNHGAFIIEKKLAKALCLDEGTAITFTIAKK